VFPAEQSTEELLSQVKLVEAANVRAASYSGGMKRRLSVAIALIGDPKILFLDEPVCSLFEMTTSRECHGINPCHPAAEVEYTISGPIVIHLVKNTLRIRFTKESVASVAFKIHSTSHKHSSLTFSRVPNQHNFICVYHVNTICQSFSIQTTGMDPITRRHVWDMIEAAKTGRAIVLTTHSMEEADILGDRIAIMARGRIRCIGTPIRLKTRFGAGYVVNVSVRTEHSTQDPGHLAEEEQRRTQVKQFFKEVNYSWNHVGLVSIRMDVITASPCVCLHS